MRLSSAYKEKKRGREREGVCVCVSEQALTSKGREEGEHAIVAGTKLSASWIQPSGYHSFSYCQLFLLDVCFIFCEIKLFEKKFLLRFS